MCPVVADYKRALSDLYKAPKQPEVVYWKPNPDAPLAQASASTPSASVSKSSSPALASAVIGGNGNASALLASKSKNDVQLPNRRLDEPQQHPGGIQDRLSSSESVFYINQRPMSQPSQQQEKPSQPEPHQSSSHSHPQSASQSAELQASRPHPAQNPSPRSQPQAKPSQAADLGALGVPAQHQGLAAGALPHVQSSEVGATKVQQLQGKSQHLEKRDNPSSNGKLTSRTDLLDPKSDPRNSKAKSNSRSPPVLRGFFDTKEAGPTAKSTEDAGRSKAKSSSRSAPVLRGFFDTREAGAKAEFQSDAGRSKASMDSRSQPEIKGFFDRPSTGPTPAHAPPSQEPKPSQEKHSPVAKRGFFDTAPSTALDRSDSDLSSKHDDWRKPPSTFRGFFDAMPQGSQPSASRPGQPSQQSQPQSASPKLPGFFDVDPSAATSTSTAKSASQRLQAHSNAHEQAKSGAPGKLAGFFDSPPKSKDASASAPGQDSYITPASSNPSSKQADSKSRDVAASAGLAGFFDAGSTRQQSITSPLQADDRSSGEAKPTTPSNSKSETSSRKLTGFFDSSVSPSTAELANGPSKLEAQPSIKLPKPAADITKSFESPAKHINQPAVPATAAQTSSGSSQAPKELSKKSASSNNAQVQGLDPSALSNGQMKGRESSKPPGVYRPLRASQTQEDKAKTQVGLASVSGW